MAKEYRSRSRILLDILHALEQPHGVGQILQKANLSHPRLKEHLQDLIGRGWAQEGADGWTLTQEGRAMRAELQRVADEMADFGLNL